MKKNPHNFILIDKAKSAAHIVLLPYKLEFLVIYKKNCWPRHLVMWPFFVRDHTYIIWWHKYIQTTWLVTYNWHEINTFCTKGQISFLRAAILWRRNKHQNITWLENSQTHSRCSWTDENLFQINGMMISPYQLTLTLSKMLNSFILICRL